nr:hypothetical protein [Novosphingobium sp. BW1]
MSEASKSWDSELVSKWLEARIQAAGRDQAAADRRGYGSEEDYDKAAAEEWACRRLKMSGSLEEQATFASAIKRLLDQDDYRITGIHDDRRVERHIRATLRKIAKMTKANEGFENRLRYQ